MSQPAAQSMVLYDGECAFCRRSMRVLRWLDAEQRLTLVPRESDEGAFITARHPELETQSTIVLVKVTPGQPDRVLTQSTAVLEAVALTRGQLGLLARAAMLVPCWMRDVVYRFIARNRHRFARCRD